MQIKKIFMGFSNFTYNLKKSTLINKHTPSENRYSAIDYFKNKIDNLIKKNKNTEVISLIHILLSRFSVTISNSIKDAEEKEYLSKYIESLGEVSVESLKKYIIENDLIAHAVDVLKKIKGSEYTLSFLESIITTEDTFFDDKLVEKRIEILKQFAGETFVSMLNKATVFLTDSDDRLVIASIRFLQNYDFTNTQMDDVEIIREKMINIFIDEETSNRIRIELLQTFLAQNWKVSGFKKRLEALLPNGYYINSQGFIRVIENAI